MNEYRDSDSDAVIRKTRRPAFADRTERRQFQAIGQPVSQTQASDAMTSRLLHLMDDLLESPCRVLVKCNWTYFSISYD